MRTSGNHVADFNIEMRFCEHCHGRGSIAVYRAEMKEYIRDLVLAGMAAKWAVHEYHLWKKTGEVTCHECEGAGSWEHWS